MTIQAHGRMRFDDKELASAEDVENIGIIAQGTIDDLVASVVSKNSKYNDMTAAINGTTRVDLIPGDNAILLSGGKMYALRGTKQVDLTTFVNSTGPGETRIAHILAKRNEQLSPALQYSKLDPNQEPEDPDDHWPTLTFSWSNSWERNVDVDRRVSDPSAQPVTPDVPSEMALVATAILDSTGVLSVTPNLNAQMSNIDAIAAKLLELEAWRGVIDPQISGFKTGIDGLKALYAALSAETKAELARLNDLIKDILSRLEAGNAVFRGSDNFIDESQSSPGAAGYAARIQEGLRFPLGTSADFKMDPTSPNDASIRIMDQKLMPAFDEVVSAESPALRMGGGTTKLQINSYGAPNFSFLLRGFAVQRVRWSGRLSQDASTSQLYATADPTRIFAAGATGDLVYDVNNWGQWQPYNPVLLRRPGFWFDLAARTFWSRLLGTYPVSGIPMVAQAYRRAGAEEITSITVPIEKAASVGSLGGFRLVLLGDINGNPDPTQVYADQTVAHGSMGNLETDVQMPYPILKPNGATLWMIVLSTSAHRLRSLPPPNFIQALFGLAKYPVLGGEVKTFVNGVWATLANVMEVGFKVKRASYKGGGTVRVPLSSLALGAGIDGIDIVAPALVPEGSSINYEVTLSGNKVRIDEASGAHPLASHPTTLPWEMIMGFTDNVAPKVDLRAIASGGAYARVFSVETALNHISSVRDPGTTIAVVKESIELRDWDQATHTLVPKLQSGGSFLTEANPDTTATEITPEGYKKISWTWVGLSIQQHRVRLIGTASDPNKLFNGRKANFSASV